MIPRRRLEAISVVDINTDLNLPGIEFTQVGEYFPYGTKFSG